MEKTLNINNTKRNNCIDIAKGIGIILVVFAHVNYTQPYQNIIYGFHMPLFFIISGLLFFPDKYGRFPKFLKQKIKTLICPYVLFVGITVLMHVCVDIVFGVPSKQVLINALNEAGRFIYSRGSLYLDGNCPLWFVTCLFLAEVILYAISKLKGVAFWVITALVTAFGWYIESPYCFTDIFSYFPWSFDSACFAVGFLAIGYKARPILSSILNKLRGQTLKCIIMTVVLMAILVPLALMNGKISIGSKSLHNGLLLYATGCIGTLSILLLSQGIGKSSFLQYCGKNSFYIMATHILFRGIFTKGCELAGFTRYDDFSIVQSLIPFLLILSASLAFTAVYVRAKELIYEQRSSRQLAGR